LATTAKIPVILLGAGSMGRNHLRLLSALPAFELLAIIEPNPAVFENTATIAVPVFASLQGFAQWEHAHLVQAAVVATPVSTHFELGQALLQMGLHVFMEKPLCANSHQAQQLCSLAQEKGLVLFTGHSERYNPAFLRFLQELPQIGPLYRLESLRIGPYPQRVGDTGVALDLAVHDLDALYAVLNAPPEWVFATTEQRLHPSFEDGLSAMLGYKDNVFVQLTVNWLSPRKSRLLNAYGHKGMLQCDFFSKQVRFFENNYNRTKQDDFGIGGIEVGQEYEYSVGTEEPLANELGQYANTIFAFAQGDKTPAQFLAASQSAVQAVRTVELLLESAQSGKKLFRAC
jgi:UDP-N-acetylglucosamine 3-dehydrogenase